MAFSWLMTTERSATATKLVVACLDRLADLDGVAPPDVGQVSTMVSPRPSTYPPPKTQLWPVGNVRTPSLWTIGELRQSRHAFDSAYYQILDSTQGRPFGAYLHGNQGTEGAEKAITTITTGLGWTKAAEFVVVSGAPTKEDREACWELGATVAAQLMGE